MPLRDPQTITLFVEDLTAAREFYAAVFDGRELFSDDVSSALSIGNVVVNLLQADRAGTPSNPVRCAHRAGPGCC